jgi:hypothetical protein
MKVYSLTQVNGGTEVGCYGVFSTPAKATEYAIQFAKDNGKEYSEETVWDGWQKCVYYGCVEDGNAGCFEITRHNVDAE